MNMEEKINKELLVRRPKMADLQVYSIDSCVWKRPRQGWHTQHAGMSPSVNILLYMSPGYKVCGVWCELLTCTRRLASWWWGPTDSQPLTACPPITSRLRLTLYFRIVTKYQKTNGDLSQLDSRLLYNVPGLSHTNCMYWVVVYH